MCTKARTTNCCALAEQLFVRTRAEAPKPIWCVTRWAIQCVADISVYRDSAGGHSISLWQDSSRTSRELIDNIDGVLQMSRLEAHRSFRRSMVAADTALMLSACESMSIQ